ncbi:MAG: hypothetical protein A2Z16_01320 [Chloroflexi bacterium RBG_16_54_18]|nr:MAG: hypothetical protein A2Z16_01320 [Chloroflexi bacterium RBG_16_54_18]
MFEFRQLYDMKKEKESSRASSRPPPHYPDHQQPGADQQGDLRSKKVAGVFPSETSCFRLISSLLIEINEKFQARKHYFAGMS